MKNICNILINALAVVTLSSLIIVPTSTNAIDNNNITSNNLENNPLNIKL